MATEVSRVSDIEYKLNYRNYENDLETYLTKYSGLRHFNDISIPLFVYFCEDDMIVNRSAVCPEKLAENPNALISCTKYGSHLSNFENCFQVTTQWITQPMLSYFANYWDAPKPTKEDVRD